MKTEEYNAGDLDPTFGKKGSTAFADVDYFFALTTDEHDNVYAAGRTLDNKYYVARLTPDGLLDKRFAGVGYISSTFGGASKSQALTINIDPKGRILVTGDQYGTGTGVCLARFMPDGKPDKTFGKDGEVIVPPERAAERYPNECTQTSNANSQSGTCTVLSDGKILLILSLYKGENPYLFKLEENGAMDKTFNGKGYVQLAYEGKAIYQTCLRVIKGERLIVGAALRPDDSRISQGFLIAYDSKGLPDRSFGKGGYCVLEKPAKEQGGLEVWDLHPLPDQKFWVVGRTGPSPWMGDPVPEHGVLTRLDTHGSQDIEFNNGDPVLTDFQGEWMSGAIQADGKVIVVGTRWGEAGVLARYHPDGTLDIGFGNNGFRYFPSVGTGRLVILQKDGRIIAGGRMAQDNGSPSSVILRYVQ